LCWQWFVLKLLYFPLTLNLLALLVKTILERTDDGSHTLFVPELKEHYHSTNGAVQESRHVYVESGIRACEKQIIHILEVGFGTGLNALLSYLEALESQKNIYYSSIELFPISLQLVNSLNYPSLFSAEQKDVFKNLHLCAWNQQVNISDFFHLKKIQANLIEYDLVGEELFDVVFYDAFAPDKQPEMWTQSIFDKLFEALLPGGVFVTYCAKGIVRRMLQKSGFAVERLAGPPGKREMLRARKPWVEPDL
jgi:tRNA U34 5-methylaminomethyl-2-thiouridine-forming methyltransferase MnmC